MRFKGKVALITAAASGIGRATANIIGREGGRIAAVDTNRERLDATIAEIGAAGGEAHPYNADALDEDAGGQRGRRRRQALRQRSTSSSTPWAAAPSSPSPAPPPRS